MIEHQFKNILRNLGYKILPLVKTYRKKLTEQTNIDKYGVVEYKILHAEYIKIWSKV